MKEQYFTVDSIHTKSRELLGNVQRYRSGRTDLIFTPSRSALLILDMQKYFLSSDSHAFVPSAGAIIPAIKTLADYYYKGNLPVFVTRHLNSREDAEMMGVWWNDLIERGNPLSELTHKIDTSKAVLLEKNQYDAFHHTNLEAKLREMKVQQIVICGVMTHLCCETTARTGFVRGFEVFFPVDGTATYNEAFHLSTLTNLAHGFVQPVLMKDLIESFL